MDKPTKPTNLIPRSFGGVKNNFSSSLQSSGYEDGVPAIYGGDNLNYQLDATGKELDYCEKICDYINAIPINKTPIVDANNKLAYTQYDVKVYNSTDTYGQEELVTGIVDGVKHIYRSKQNNNIGQALTNDVYWERTDILGGVKTIGRNIGEIVPSSLPLTDAGLHLLDGALIDGSGSYSAFVTYIAGLVSTYPNLFVTESAWQTSVTTYGVCGKFVYDSVNNTVRLPKITGIVEGTTDVSALGDLVEAGLPNITGDFFGSDIHTDSYANGAFRLGSVTTTREGGGVSSLNNGGFSFDASRSSSIYGNSNTVQPQTIKVLYYIVIATSSKTDIQVDIDEIATDLNGKADVDLTNCTKPHIVETYVNGTSWYRVYSDGWCEQGGKFVINSASVGADTYSTANLTLPQSYTKLTSYYVQAKHDRFNAGFASDVIGGACSVVSVYQVNDSSTNSFANPYVVWETKGYIS